MRNAWYLVLALLWAVSVPCSGQYSVTFATLGDSLNSEQRANLQYFDIALEKALDGDLSSQVYLAMRLDRKETRVVGRALWRQIYEERGFDLGEFEHAENVWFGYQFLPGTYMEPKQGVPDPEKGLDLLRELSLRGSTIAASELDYHLRYSPLLPESEGLADAWKAYLAEGNRFGIELFQEQADLYPEEVPDPESFSTCTGVIAKLPEVNEMVAQAQAKILQSPEQANSLLESLYDEVEALLPSAATSRVTFKFSHVTVTAVLHLLASLYEDDSLRFYTPASLPPMHVYVHAANVPRLMIMAKLFKLFQLSPRCSEQWVTVSAPDTKANERTKAMMLGVVMRKTEANDGRGEIHWSSGASYVGELRDGVAHGEGRYELPDGEISGEFQDGIAHGQASYRIGTNYQEYEGEFARGYFNGEGHLIDHQTGDDWNGRFVNHEFTGTGRVSVRASYIEAEEYVSFTGPIENSLAHGRGTCEIAKISYACTFYKGNLTAVGDVSLFPNELIGE